MSNLVLKTIDRYGIRDKVRHLLFYYILSILVYFFKLGWGTADNATNNDTCLKALAKHIDPNDLRWDPIKRRVRCVT